MRGDFLTSRMTYTLLKDFVHGWEVDGTGSKSAQWRVLLLLLLNAGVHRRSICLFVTAQYIAVMSVWSFLRHNL